MQMRWTSGIGKMTVDKPAEQACRFPQNLHPRLRIYRRLFSTVGNTGLIGKAIPTIPGNTRYFMRYLQHTACKKSAHCPAILWREPKQLHDMKYCRQRISKGYCDADLYSIHDWFFAVVPDMLEQYKKHRRGSPGVLGVNYTNERGILVNDICHAEWDEILTEMIHLFREADDTTCQRKNSHEDE